MSGRTPLFATALLAAILITVILLTRFPQGADATLIVYADRTLQAPLEEIASMYSSRLARDGVSVNITFVYGSSGYVLSQLELKGYGDLYVSDDSYFASLGIEKGLLDPGTYKEIGYIKLVLLVSEGNPKNITSLGEALSRSDVRIAIGNPEHVSAGILAFKVFREHGVADTVDMLVRDGRVIYVKSAAEAASYVMIGLADAAISFNIYEAMHPDKLDIVEDPWLADVKAPVVVVVPVSHGDYSMDFYRFVLEHREVFSKYGVYVPSG